MASLLSY